MTTKEILSVIIDLHDIYLSEMTIAKQQSNTNLIENALIHCFCDDMWYQLCTNTILSLPDHDSDNVQEQMDVQAGELVNQLFNSFDETQFFDLTNGSVRNYIDSLGAVYLPEDYVGDYLYEPLYWKVFAFVETCMWRVYKEFLKPLFAQGVSSVINIETCMRLKNHYKLTVELYK